MKVVNHSVVYASIIAFIVGLLCGGVLVGLPQEGYLAVMIGVIGLLIAYAIYHQFGGKQ